MPTNITEDPIVAKRKIFEEMIEGIGAMKGHRSKQAHVA